MRGRWLKDLKVWKGLMHCPCEVQLVWRLAAVQCLSVRDEWGERRPFRVQQKLEVGLVVVGEEGVLFEAGIAIAKIDDHVEGVCRDHYWVPEGHAGHPGHHQDGHSEQPVRS